MKAILLLVLFAIAIDGNFVHHRVDLAQVNSNTNSNSNTNANTQPPPAQTSTSAPNANTNSNPSTITQSPPPAGSNTQFSLSDSHLPLQLLNPNDTIILLIDHQTGLFQTVHDISLYELRNNVKILASAANLGRVPIIYTASEPNGPNGPIISDVLSLPSNATFVPRHGEISAWENPDFVAAVKNSGKKTLVMAGVWTSVCIVFPALQAKAEGFTVYAVIDASGDISMLASETTRLRLALSGIVPVTTNVVVGEIQRTWNRPDAAAWGALYSQLSPNYAAVTESFMKSSNKTS
jgi:nicotinamidase-related amidase